MSIQNRKGNEYGMNKQVGQKVSRRRNVFERRGEECQRENWRNLSGNSFVSMINSPRTKSKLTNGMLQSFSRDSLQNRQTPPRTQREKIDEISWQMIDQVKAFERQYTTTNSDLTTRSTSAATCLKSFDARNARLEHEKLRDPNNVNRRRHSTNWTKARGKCGRS